MTVYPVKSPYGFVSGMSFSPFTGAGLETWKGFGIFFDGLLPDAGGAGTGLVADDAFPGLTT